MKTTEEIDENRILQKPSIKLSRTSKGLYSWELKILELDVNKIEKLNDQMVEKFGDIGE